MTLEKSLRASCVRQNRGLGFYFNENEKLSKGCNWGSDVFSLLKITGCCEAREEAGRLLESLLVDGILASAVAVEMEQRRCWVQIFWGWSRKYLLNGLAVGGEESRRPSRFRPKPRGLMVPFAGCRLEEEQAGWG